METKQLTFTQLLEMHLNTTIQKEFNGKTELTVELLIEIRNRIRVLLANIFNKSKNYSMHSDSINWLANRYFSAINIAKGDIKDLKIGDIVVFNEYKLEDLPHRDIELLTGLYNKTAVPWKDALKEELLRRSSTLS